jgi:hypothetical protein
MNEKIEDSDKLYKINTEISNDLNDNRRRAITDSKNKINSKSFIKNHDDEITTSFGDFVLMMDNREEYRKTVINNAKKKIRKAMHKIKETKDVSKLFNDPSSTKWYIINPDQNKIKPIFDSLFCLLLYMDFIISPFEFFVYQSQYKYYRIMIFDIFFSLEIISHFFIAYYDTRNKYYITDIKKIFINYLKSGFLPSLLYVLPFYLIRDDLEMFRFIKLFRYPYVNNKIKRLVTWFLSFIIKNVTIISQIVRVFTFFLSICYIIHICACFYCFLGLIFTDSWIYAHSDALDNKNIIDIYVSSYYFLAETLSSTGYGDLTPSNYAELSFIMFCEIINCGLYAYLLSNILDILLNKDNSNSYKYRANQINLENWIMYYMKKLPSSSRKENLHRNNIWNETKKYFELYYNPSKNFKWIQDKNFISQMKPSQRNKLMSHAFRAIFNKFYSFFKRISLLSSKIKIVMNFKTSIQVAKTELTNNMKKNHKIYFIDKGIVNIYKNGNQIFSLTDGYFFGIESFLLDENKDDKISYKVSDECSYAILYTIDISYLIKEVLNYDSESFISLINLADFYIDNIIKEQNTNLFIKERQESLDEMAKITNPKKSILSIKSDSLNNDINMINNYSDITGNIEDFIIENMIPKRKINCDLLQPGYLPELDAKLAEYQRANNVIDESNLKIDLVNKQINFVNKYIGRLLDE